MILWRGVYYSKADFYHHNDLGFFFMDFGFLTFVSVPTSVIPHNVLPSEYFGGTTINDAEDETRSAFAAFNFRPTDRFTINLGGRYTSFKKTANRTQYRSRVDANLNTWQKLPSADEEALNIILGGDNSNYSPNSRTDDDFMPSISIQYDLTDNVMGYASYMQGFKAGGYSYSNFPDIYNPEYVDAYEVGLKGFFLNHRVFAGINYFYNKYDDLQETAVLAQGVTIVNVVRNAASSVSKGIELDANLMVTENLILKANLATLSSKYESFPNGACSIPLLIAAGGSTAPCIQDMSGKTRAYSPEYSGSISAEYNLNFGSYRMQIEPSVFFTDDISLSYEADPWLVQEAYEKFDLRISLSPLDEKRELLLPVISYKKIVIFT